jgi:hypothetical protein
LPSGTTEAANCRGKPGLPSGFFKFFAKTSSEFIDLQSFATDFALHSLRGVMSGATQDYRPRRPEGKPAVFRRG